jgi:hypothetical protein
MDVSPKPVISAEEQASEYAARIAVLEAKSFGLATAAAALTTCDPVKATEMLHQKREADEAKESIIAEQNKGPSDEQPVVADEAPTREEAYKHQAKCRRQETKAKEQSTNAQRELEALKEQLITAESKVSFTAKQVSKAIKESQAADRVLADWSEPEIQKEETNTGNPEEDDDVKWSTMQAEMQASLAAQMATYLAELQGQMSAERKRLNDLYEQMRAAHGEEAGSAKDEKLARLQHEIDNPPELRVATPPAPPLVRSKPKPPKPNGGAIRVHDGGKFDKQSAASKAAAKLATIKSAKDDEDSD